MANLEISRAQRLDQKVVEMMPELSRAFATKLINDGRVYVNEKAQTKAGYKMREGDTVRIDYDTIEHTEMPRIDLEILYEDADCIVINKPVGVLTHSKGAFNPEATVESWLQQHLKDTIGSNKTGIQEADYLAWLHGGRAGIVHRLDRGTSGVMICAKTPDALNWLQKQFAQRRTKKTYFAVVNGSLKMPEALIDLPIERNPKAPATFRIGINGKSARTTYRVVNENEKYSLIELKPETGRTHQLRVHLQHLGHPIIGDVLYGGEQVERMMLHAAELELTLPSRARKVFMVPVPKEFEEMFRA